MNDDINELREWLNTYFGNAGDELANTIEDLLERHIITVDENTGNVVLKIEDDGWNKSHEGRMPTYTHPFSDPNRESYN